MPVIDTSSPPEFYDFNSQTFSSGFIASKNLKLKMKSNTFSKDIHFPANGSGDTYTVLLFVPANKDTQLDFGYGKNSYSTTISQLANTALTFTPATGSSASYQTFSSTGAANVTSTVNPTSTDSVTKNIEWLVKNTDSDAQGYGLRLTRQPVDSDWYFETTETADGAVDSDSNKLVVDDLTDLVIGMELTYITGTTAPGAATTIIDIDTNTKTLTLSRDQAITDGHTMTFRAYGSSLISSAIGGIVDFSSWRTSTTSATEDALTKTVRGAVSSSTTVTLNGTRGISGGGFVKIKGVGVENTSTNLVQTNRTDGSTATASASAGEIIMQVAQTLTSGTEITFKGSTNVIKLSNHVIISSNPPSNQIIYLNLDNFITPGVQTTS